MCAAALYSKTRPEQNRGPLSPDARTVALVAYLPSSLRVSWRVAPAPKHLLPAGKDGDIVTINSQAIYESGQSGDIVCAVDPADPNSTSMIPLDSVGFSTGAAGFKSRPEIKVVELARTKSNYEGKQTSSEILVVRDSSSAPGAVLRITSRAF